MPPYYGVRFFLSSIPDPLCAAAAVLALPALPAGYGRQVSECPSVHFI
jgi:hypothetical protein